MRNRKNREQAAVFGLTGGFGSGKSTVGRQLASHGAAVFDADAIVRELSQPGKVGFTAMVDILGPGIITADNTLDTREIAALIFGDSKLRRHVERAIHPLVWEALFTSVHMLDPQTIVVFEVPLLRPADLVRLSGTMVVETDPALAGRRLQSRGFTAAEVQARIKAQAGDGPIGNLADFIITNNGTPTELQTAAREAWHWMKAKARD